MTGKTPYKFRVSIFAFLAFFLLSSACWAATYYVSATGGSDSNPGTLSQPWKTIGKANSTLQAGDTVFIRQGTYNQTIRPAKSGSSGSPITYARYDDEQVTITNVYDGAELRGRHYIVLDGLRFIDVDHYWVNMNCYENGYAFGCSTHNTIKNCYMKGTDGWSGISIRSQANYNKILNNTLIASCDANSSGPMDSILLWASSYNIVEGNSFGNAVHNAIGLQGYPLHAFPAEYNVIRNNTFQNKWHTNIGTWANADRTLVEGNISVDAGEEHTLNLCGSAADRAGARYTHAGIKAASSYGIYRKNVLINNGWFELQSYGNDRMSHHNRIYFNTFYKNYYGLYGNTADPVTGNIFKNNIWYDHNTYAIFLTYTSTDRDNCWIRNNILGGPLRVYPDGVTTLANLQTKYPTFWYDNLSQDPKFVDAPNRDLHLADTSPMIDAGAWLTKTTSSGSGTIIPIADARYFMDGWGIVEGDLIQLQGQSKAARITSVDYANNKITVDTSLSWTNGQGVSLAYHGSAPDIGALEYVPAGDSTAPSPPRNLQIVEIR